LNQSIELNHQYLSLSHPDDDQEHQEHHQQQQAERMSLEEQEQAGRRLYLASKQGDTKQARELLKSRAASALLVEFVAHDENDQTPLWIACQRGHREIVSILIDFGASKNARSRVRLIIILID